MHLVPWIQAWLRRPLAVQRTPHELPHHFVVLRSPIHHAHAPHQTAGSTHTNTTHSAASLSLNAEYRAPAWAGGVPGSSACYLLPSYLSTRIVPGKLVMGRGSWLPQHMACMHSDPPTCGRLSHTNRAVAVAKRASSAPGTAPACPPASATSAPPPPTSAAREEAAAGPRTPTQQWVHGAWVGPPGRGARAGTAMPRAIYGPCKRVAQQWRVAQVTVWSAASEGGSKEGGEGAGVGRTLDW